MLSNAHGYVLFVFINSDLVICNIWDSPLFISVIICGLKRICQIKKGSTLVCSAHVKPEDMYKTMTGLTRRKQHSLHGPRRAKSTNKKNCKGKKKFADQQIGEKRLQFFVNSVRFNSHKKTAG